MPRSVSFLWSGIFCRKPSIAEPGSEENDDRPWSIDGSRSYASASWHRSVARHSTVSRRRRARDLGLEISRKPSARPHGGSSSASVNPPQPAVSGSGTTSVDNFPNSTIEQSKCHPRCPVYAIISGGNRLRHNLFYHPLCGHWTAPRFDRTGSVAR